MAGPNDRLRNIDSTILLLLAGLPIIALIAMLALRVRALTAVVIAIALTLAMFPWFPISADTLTVISSSLTGVTISVALIMYGGIALSELLSVSGAQEHISGWLNRAAHGRDRSVLLLGLGIAPLAESIIGWGVGVIIAVPLLIRVGFSPTKAITIGLLGIVFSPWGSLGPGLLIVTGMTGFALPEVGTWIALLNLPVLLVMGITMSIVGMGVRGAVRMSGEILGGVLVMWLALIATNAWISPSLAGIVASLAGIVCFIGFARLRGNRVPAMDRQTVRAFMPYSALIGSMLVVTGVTAVTEWGELEWYLTNPALWLIVTAALTPTLLRVSHSDVPAILRRSARTWLPVCSITVLFIAFGALLSANGMTELLAAAAASLGIGFLVILPSVGFLAGYVTASNSASAAMLTLGISHTAASLGANPIALLGVQNVVSGAAVMVSPSRVALAVGVAQAQSPDGAEPLRLRRVLGVTLTANAVVLALLTLLAPLLLG